jgi:hypothetical protein
LPPSIHAEDFSGSLWHGSAGKISVDARDAGALEWRLHPASLFGMTLAADIHWVKIGFVIDAALQLTHHGYTAHNLSGGGPVEDLRDFGVGAGWRGTANIQFSELAGDFDRPTALAGDIQVANLTSAQFADGADLGGYDLHLGANAVDADGNIAAQLNDTGGPLDVQATVRVSMKERRALLTGALTARPDAPPALLQQIDGLSQLRGRDSQGRIPMDFEFNF